jgi:hypothetical protein
MQIWHPLRMKVSKLLALIRPTTHGLQQVPFTAVTSSIGIISTMISITAAVLVPFLVEPYNHCHYGIVHPCVSLASFSGCKSVSSHSAARIVVVNACGVDSVTPLDSDDHKIF